MTIWPDFAEIMLPHDWNQRALRSFLSASSVGSYYNLLRKKVVITSLFSTSPPQSSSRDCCLQTALLHKTKLINSLSLAVKEVYELQLKRSITRLAVKQILGHMNPIAGWGNNRQILEIQNPELITKFWITKITN